MFKIIDKQELGRDITKITVEVPIIAKRAKAGQFVVVIVDEKGERIPLTLADWDKDKGTISLIFQKVGYTTKKLGLLNVGSYILDILGPLGHPTETKNLGTVICIGGGVGIAEVYPVSRAFKEAGNRVIGIIGSRSKDFLILEDKMRRVCDELFIATDDGSYGHKGFVTDVLKGILNWQTGKWFDKLTIPRTIPSEVEGQANRQMVRQAHHPSNHPEQSRGTGKPANQILCFDLF